jgi:hypothetical protein
MTWYQVVIRKLEASDVFHQVSLVGAKVRAQIDAARFLDVHYDPTTGSYSYALIDLELPYPGDKRVLGWDDYPHEGVTEIEALDRYPHHFHRRAENGRWIFEASSMRGDLAHDIDVILAVVRDYLQS